MIIKRYNRRLYRVVRAVVDDDSEAEDILQEAYVRAFTHLSDFRGEARFSTWLTRIALNEALARRRQRRPMVDVEAIANSSVPFLHSPFEVGTEARYARRSATKKYRTTPLRALWQHPPYFHDGSAADLLAVVNHYDRQFRLGLNDRHKADLVEYLKTL